MAAASSTQWVVSAHATAIVRWTAGRSDPISKSRIHTGSKLSNENDPLLARLDLARQIAAEAGRITLKYFRDPQLAVERKADASPVTVADRESEQFMRDEIAKYFPRDGIVGEEFGEQEGDSEYCWILDPIDGTKSFVSGVPLYGCLVGLAKDGDAVAGVIQMPALNECVYAATGQGAWLQTGGGDPEPARVSSRGQLSESLFCTTAVRTFADRTDGQGMAAYGRLQAAANLTRTWGDCYGYLLVATGRAEIMVDPVISVWDACAVKPIVEEAGGTFTDWHGKATIHSQEGVATNGLFHPEVLSVLAGK